MSPYWQGSTPARVLGRCRRVLARVGRGGRVPRGGPRRAVSNERAGLAPAPVRDVPGPQIAAEGFECGCARCDAARRSTLPWPERLAGRMILCPRCGNKRCPRASYHGNDCTGSNECGANREATTRLPLRAAAMSEPFPISPEAESFIESAKILAEPYEEEIAALRAEHDRLLALVAAQAEQIPELRAEVERLRALTRTWETAVRAEDAEAQIARVRALHEPYVDSVDVKCCTHCGDIWPCPTIAALDGEATP